MSKPTPSQPATNTPSNAESLDERIASFAQLALPPAVAVGAVVAGYIQGPPMAILVLAAGMLFGTVALFWSSLRAMFGETRLTGADAFAMGAPSSEEEQKRAVMQALKDIEFERSIGKIAEEDYLMLRTRYRTEAKRLLRLLDNRAAPARKRAEELAKAHLLERQLLDPGDPRWAVDGDDAASGAVESSAAGDMQQKTSPGAQGENPYIDESKRPASDDEDELAEQVPTQTCSNCGVVNDGDAMFCKKCGTRFDKEMIA